MGMRPTAEVGLADVRAFAGVLYGRACVDLQRDGAGVGAACVVAGAGGDAGGDAGSSKLVVLKARQLGLSWLSLAYALWLLTFHAPATVLLFSLKEDEAVELLNRLKGMYWRLPPHLRARSVVRDAAKTFELSTGSRALAFSTHGGRSYTGTLAIVDEADFVPDLNAFLNAVKPTDGRGRATPVGEHKR